MECWVVERGEFEPERPGQFDGPFATKATAIEYMRFLEDQATAHPVRAVMPKVGKSGVRGG